ncbi:MAG: biopolymer transport protein TolR [Pseudomonadota bacterium]|jgi:biopolymer transport protein TolR|nr:biopolymer transport protein TolR [Pseudomonadota bacterium]MDQ5902630.1 biopolymer transport protein TolR [Pseudomonadota bacterium]MDQ5960312.1 biopolymer transport protein TolR [Pseudomonadota bacterium]
MRPRRLKNEINVVPYIDVMLVLLVIFMVAAPMMTTGSVDLPTTGKSSQVPSNPTRVMVRSDGSIAIKDPKGNDSSVDKAGLATYLRSELAKNADLAVLVAGDKNAKYEAVLDVLDSIKQQDVKRVGLETVRKQ